MESAHQLLLNLANNCISLFQLFSCYYLKTDTSELLLLPSPTLQELNFPLGVATLGYGEESWIHKHNLCYGVQMPCNGKTSPLLFQNYYFFLFKEQAEQ